MLAEQKKQAERDLLGEARKHLIVRMLVIGNAKREPLSEMCENYEYRDHPLVRTLAERGPLPLLEEAVRHGLAEDKDGYVSKCHLCFVARKFFRERGSYADEVGPDEVYTG